MQSFHTKYTLAYSQGASCTLKKYSVKTNQSISLIARARKTLRPAPSHRNESGAWGIPTGSTPKLSLQLGDPEFQLPLPCSSPSSPRPPSQGRPTQALVQNSPLNNFVLPSGGFQALQLPHRIKTCRADLGEALMHIRISFVQEAKASHRVPSTLCRRRRHLHQTVRELTNAVRQDIPRQRRPCCWTWRCRLDQQRRSRPLGTLAAAWQACGSSSWHLCTDPWQGLVWYSWLEDLS